MTPKTYVFEVPGKPVGKQRARTVRVGKGPKPKSRTYTPDKTVEYATRVALSAQLARVRIDATDGPVMLDIIAVWPYPSRTKKAVRESGKLTPKPTKPDADNVEKAVADALEGIAYGGDGRVTIGVCLTCWGPTAKTIVRVHPWNVARARMLTDGMGCEFLD